MTSKLFEDNCHRDVLHPEGLLFPLRRIVVLVVVAALSVSTSLARREAKRSFSGGFEEIAKHESVPQSPSPSLILPRARRRHCTYQNPLKKKYIYIYTALQHSRIRFMCWVKGPFHQGLFFPIGPIWTRLSPINHFF